MTLVVTIDAESPRLAAIRLAEEAVRSELEKKKHGLGAVRVYAYKTDDVSEAALCFAEKILEAAKNAVDERIC